MNAAGFHLALIEPEIPQNTGNIGRTCVATGVPLHLVRPFGFSLEDKYLKRAGLDYWPYLDVSVHESRKEFFAAPPGNRVVLTTSRGGTPLHHFRFETGDLIVLGRESVGLPRDLFATFSGHHVTIPMVGPTRSLNIASSAAVLLYEALFQMEERGVAIFDDVSGVERRDDAGPKTHKVVQ